MLLFVQYQSFCLIDVNLVMRDGFISSFFSRLSVKVIKPRKLSNLEKKFLREKQGKSSKFF